MENSDTFPSQSNSSVTDLLQASFRNYFNPNSTINSIEPQVIQLLQIELLVLIIAFLLLLLFLLGCLRRRIQSTLLKFVTNALYTLIPVAIPFVIGRMQVSPVHRLFPIWALFLVFAYGGVATITAFNLADNDKKVVYWLHTLLLWVWCGIFVWFILQSNELKRPYFYPVLALFILTRFNIQETMEAFRAASKTDGLQQVLEETIAYVAEGDNLTSSQQYKYLIDVVPGSKKLITTQEMWQTKLLSKSGEVEETSCIRAQRLKDVCLSFAFHKILLMKFAGLSLSESFVRYAKSFAEVELVSLESKQVERVIQIIEVELQFVFEFFYTKFYILSKKNLIHKITRLLGAMLCIWFAFVTLHKNWSLGTHPSGIKYEGRRLEVGITRVVMVIFAALECLQFSMGIFSNWTIVRLLCSYVNEPLECSKWTIVRLFCIFAEKLLGWKVEEKVITLIWGINDRLSVKPWKRNLGQYSLFECFHRNSVGQLVSEYVDLVKVPCAGQKGASSVALSTQVKRAIILSLKSNGLTLSPSPRAASLHRNAVGELSYACENATCSRVILVWHVATAFYEELSSEISHDDDNFRVATELSKYCAYLVTFSCELLPDDLYVAPKAFKDAIQDAKFTFGGLNQEERHAKMKIMNERDCTGVIRDGFVLAKKLIWGVRRDEGKGWRVLAEFWAELLLFLAPSDNATAHIEHLAQGGEFITHLWALLTHVGVVSRNHYRDTMV